MLAKPGDTINIRGGKYCERVAVTSSGNATQGYITFRSEPGETAVLDGSCLTPEVGDSPLVALRNASYVKIEHLEIGNYQTADPTRVPAGIRVYGHGSHIEIRDNNVHNIEQTYQGREGPGRGANGFGIAVYGTDAARSDHRFDRRRKRSSQPADGIERIAGIERQRDEFSSHATIEFTTITTSASTLLDLSTRRKIPASIGRATESSPKIMCTTSPPAATQPMETMPTPTAFMSTAEPV